MSAIYDWDVPFTFDHPYGSLDFNQPVAFGTDFTGCYLLDETGCDSGATLRVVRDDEPQTSGEILHNSYRAGYQVTLKLELWAGGSDGRSGPACDDERIRMGDALNLGMNGILGDDPLIPADGRLTWTPASGVTDRMLDRIRLLDPRPGFAKERGFTIITFSAVSPFPYAMDAPETDSALVNGVPSTLTNLGTSAFWPVVEVYGPTSYFELSNASYLDLNGLPAKIIFDADLPGAVSVGPTDYIEFGFFRNTAYLNGNSTNMKAGINLQDSDYWPLIPGDNVIEIAGAPSALVKWQSAWS